MTELPTPVGMMSVTYGIDRKVKLPVYDSRQMQEYAKMEVLAEREACAKLCEKAIASIIWEYGPEDVKQTGTNVCNNLAAAIRARGQK